MYMHNLTLICLLFIYYLSYEILYTKNKKYIDMFDFVIIRLIIGLNMSSNLGFVPDRDHCGKNEMNPNKQSSFSHNAFSSYISAPPELQILQ